MPDNGTSIGSLLSGAVSALGQGASDMIRKVGQLEIYDKRERARSDAFVMDRVEKDPALLSIPEIARSYDRVLGAKNAHLIKLEEYQNQQQLRQVFNQLISSKITPVPGQTLQTAERTATVGPQGVTSQTPSTSGTITTPSTLPKMEPGEEVDIGPKGATYKRKGLAPGSGKGAGAIVDEYRAAAEAGDTEKADYLHQLMMNKEVSPLEKQKAFADYMTAILPGRAGEEARAKPVAPADLQNIEILDPNGNTVPAPPGVSRDYLQGLADQGLTVRYKGSKIPFFGKKPSAAIPPRAGTPGAAAPKPTPAPAGNLGDVNAKRKLLGLPPLNATY